MQTKAEKQGTSADAGPGQKQIVSQVVSPSQTNVIPPNVQLWGWAIIVTAVAFTLVFYFIRFRKFTKDYAKLAARMDRHYGNRGESALSPGHTYTVASRGPSHARDAEMQSAEARWRHLSMAFPHLDDRGQKRPLILVSRDYTSIKEVNEMQEWLGGRISGRGRTVLKPAWIEQLGEDFDALRHPQLAIANPAIYTFPFFLTWQRRHQWGVLPYAAHNRLGVICHPDHPQKQLLTQTQRDYSDELSRAKSEQTAFWVNDPKYARWLPLLLESAGPTPTRLDRKNNTPFAQQHTSNSLFSVGAYLHKEILPLVCSILPDIQAGARYAEFVQELEVSDFTGTFLPAKVDDFPKSSAVIVDLAIIPPELERDGWLVLRLPHCVYVPIGIGYSVATVPLLLEDAAWRNTMLRDVGEVLTPASDKLSFIGIELDKRLWTADLT